MYSNTSLSRNPKEVILKYKRYFRRTLLCVRRPGRLARPGDVLGGAGLRGLRRPQRPQAARDGPGQGVGATVQRKVHARR